jgi:phosphohistidine phosphatase SixA
MSRTFACRLVLLYLFALLVASTPAAADEAAAWAALRDGGYVALMRHALAPGGAGDPPGFRLDDCATQRNLSEDGRADAAAVGAMLWGEEIVIGKVLSSPWCRCVDTAKLMNLGAVEIAPTFSNAFVLREKREELTAGARMIIAGWRGPGNLLVVTHGANIQALTGGGNPDSGEIVVVAADADGTVREVGRIPVPKR